MSQSGLFRVWVAFLLMGGLAIGCQNQDPSAGTSRSLQQAERLQPTTMAPRPSNPPPQERNLWDSGHKRLPRADFEPGVVLVKFKSEITATRADGLAAELGLVRARPRGKTGVDKMLLANRGEAVLAAVERLKRDPRVEYAEPNHRIELLNVPNDPRFGECWGMDNTGQTGGTADADIDAPEAWDISIGSWDVVVAVLDTGVDYTHPDLAANMWTNENEIPNNSTDDDNNGYVDDVRGWDFEDPQNNDPMDDYGHGTHCSGIIGAAGNNNLGVAGVNWRVTIMPIRIIGNQDLDAYCLDAAEGIHYAVDNGADVMSCSWWTIEHYNQTLEQAVQYSESAGVFLVAAAGNDSRDDDDPGYSHWPSEWPYSNIIAVAATNHEDGRAYFSNWGPTTVDVGAPGEDILSCIWPGGGYELMSGTSMAAPHVAGTVALMLSIRPDLTVDQLKQFLFNTIDPIADLQGLTVSGGRINAHRAMQAISGVPLPPVALAGGDRMVMTGSDVTLDGSKSFDPNQDAITYSWEFYPPSHSGASLDDDTIATPSFFADVCGQFQAVLTVTDDSEDHLSSDPDRAKIHVMNYNELGTIIETDHPYLASADQTWTIQQPGSVTMSVHFASFDTESNFDYVYILDGDDQEVAVYDGALGEFNSVAVDGDTIKIHFTSDGSVQRDGFVIDSVWWCDAGNCPPGLGDCNDDPADGCETDTSSAIENCGWCGHYCAFPHATAACETGRCVISDCETGWTDCNLDTADGCEADLLVDPINCGSCGFPCGPYDHAVAGCAGGQCAIGECEAGWDDCNGVLDDGCEQDVSADIDNCGACGNICALDHTVSHTCVAGECFPMGDCTVEAVTGIESAHPYTNNFDYTWEIVRPGAAQMSVHFSSFDTERNYDYVYIYDGADVQYAVYHGTQEAFDSVVVPGDTIRIRLDTDGSVTRDGFIVDTVRFCDSGCADDWGNCDADPTNGCETDTLTDLDHCGACGQMCGAPNTNGQCIGGTCNPGSDCQAGFADCNVDMSDGCEVDLNSDPANCGTCGFPCVYDNAIPLCAAGQCEMGDCLAGFGDCNVDDSDGCESNLLADFDNCGACGNGCTLPHVDDSYCDVGMCQIGSCTTQTHDDIQTAHPYDIDTDLEWVIQHPGAESVIVHFSMFDTELNYDYVRLFDGSDNQVAQYWGNLGAFTSDPVPGDTVRVVFFSDYMINRDGFILDWSRGCSVGGCEAGWTDCDAEVTNGCEADILTDPQNCGGCGTVCDYEHAVDECDAGGCQMGACEGGWEDCDNDVSDGCEIHIFGDPQNCGFCSNECGPYDNATPICANASCGAACDADWGNCNSDLADGCETDLTGDPIHCGNCASACAFDNAAASCVDSQCVMGACLGDWGDCNTDPVDGCEADTATDVDNCGGCNAPCSAYDHAAVVCVTGACAMGACETGFADCNSSPADGCETSLGTDSDCTACADTCTDDFAHAGGHCVAGSCAMDACESGYGDCNTSPADGCEIALGSIDHCSACDDACAYDHGTAACTAGSCELAACDANWGDCDTDAINGCESDLTTSAHCGACATACTTGEACVDDGNGFACSSTCPDADGDGYADADCGGTDCDDASAGVHPGAAESCNSIDDNCDGATDEGFDADGDGYKSCGANPDCDDDDDAVHPGATEICGDNIDQDCSGADLACDCPDLDGDGFDDSACGGDDCADNDADIHPGAAEVCDSLDNNCNDEVDEGGVCDDGGGCGCGTTGSAPAGTLFALLGLVALGRNRRRTRD